MKLTQFSTVVLPIDLSADSRELFDVAVDVATAFGSRRIHLVHVVRDLHAWMRDLPAYSGSAVREAIESIATSANDRLHEYEAPPGSHLSVTREARIGSPAREIVAAAEETGGDLLLMATQRRASVGRCPLGSVTHTVVRAARCPVLVLDERRPWKHPKRVLAPIDLSPISEQVVARAIQVARASGAEVVVLSAYDLAWTSPTSFEAAPLPLGDLERAALAEHHRAEVDRIVSSVRDEGLSISRIITPTQPPAKSILHHAKEIDADLIVLGATGHNAWQRMFLGSTATRVVSDAACPVLVVAGV